MKKLTKDQVTTLEKHREAVQQAWDDCEAAINKLKEVTEEAADFVGGLRDEARSYYDEKSERWQEGDAGTAYDAWIETLDEAADNLENIEVELPEDVKETLDNLPTDPGEV